MRTIKYIVPIYGVKPLRESPLQLQNDVILRSVRLLDNEQEIFEKHNMRTGYESVLEVNYSFDEDNPSEPLPGISINLLNMIDASLVVYGEGKPGLAAILPADGSVGGGFILSHYNPSFGDYLDKELNSDYISYFEKFKNAYDMRPLAFDLFRRSQERFTNNDKTIESCTVLESILVPKGEKSKKSFILNGMKIMGFVADEIARIEKLVDYRNAIIHADREKILRLLSGTDYTHSWFEDAFKLVREILYKYVEKPWD